MTARPPSVCMLVFSYPPESTGGAEQQCRLQARELVRLGHDCLVLTTRRHRATPRSEQGEGGEILRIRTVEAWLEIFRRSKLLSAPAPAGAQPQTTGASRPSFSARAVRGLNALLFILGAGTVLFHRRRRIEVIHAHGADWHAGFAGWIGHLLSISVVCKGANVPAFPDLTGIPFARLWAAWRTRIHFIALTEAMRDDLMAKGVPADRIDVLPNGVELPAEAADPGKSALVLHAANYTQPAWNKAFDVLYATWPLVARTCPQARLAAAGAGDVARWERELAAANARGTVDFIGYRTDLADWIRRAAVFVLPSRHEGISNALLEAQSAGVPAVVSDIPGNRAVVVDGETGLVVPAGDAEALAHALIRLLSDLDLRRRLGAAARRRMETEFGIAAVARQLSNLYGRLAVERKN